MGAGYTPKAEASVDRWVDIGVLERESHTLGVFECVFDDGCKFQFHTHTYPLFFGGGGDPFFFGEFFCAVFLTNCVFLDRSDWGGVRGRV